MGEVFRDSNRPTDNDLCRAKAFTYKLSVDAQFATWVRNSMLGTRVALAIYGFGWQAEAKVFLMACIVMFATALWQYRENQNELNRLLLAVSCSTSPHKGRFYPPTALYAICTSVVGVAALWTWTELL